MGSAHLRTIHDQPEDETPLPYSRHKNEQTEAQQGGALTDKPSPADPRARLDDEPVCEARGDGRRPFSSGPG